MKYRIELHGRGGECYVHLLDEEQQISLLDSGVEDDEMDSEEIANVLNKDDIFETDDIFLGPYYDEFSLLIKVYNESENLMWESEDGTDFKTENEFKFVDDKSLIVEDYVKGHFFSFEVELDEEFDPDKICLVLTEIGEKVEIVTGIIYNDVDLQLFKSYDGDYWSKGLTYYIN